MPIKLLNGVENIGMHCTLFLVVSMNFIMDEGQPNRSELQNGKRLTGIKKYDPNNFFRVNQNIVPN
jgi:hypothetical protein